jgi:3-hydroxyacyl-[acyl-carrier-protein] dehydratase
MASERAERRSDVTAAVSMPLEHPEIIRRLPHRYPFLFVDRVLSFVDGQSLVAVKNVTADEPVFTGHFPGRPVLPGVIICEALVQAGGLLAALSSDGLPRGRGVVLAGLEHVRFRRMVVPGDQLRLEIELLHKRRPLWKMKGRALVGDVLAAEAEFLNMEIEETLPGF